MIPDKIKDMMEQLEKAGYEAFVIGGAVRDFFFRVPPNDFDLFTNATGEQILEVFPKGVVIGGEERQAKILTVIVEGVEISQYRSNGDRTETGLSLAKHQSTCDLSINSIAINKDNVIFDPQGGQSDIELKLLRFVGNPEDRIKEDPLRILRAIRFIAKHNLDLANTDVHYALKCNNEFMKLPLERVTEELLKILKYEKGIKFLSHFGLLSFILPEYKKVENMEGGDHHTETVNTHLHKAFEEAYKLTDNVLLRLACFLHDIGKGTTFTKDEDGKIHFYEHDIEGQKQMEKRLLALKFSTEGIKYITTLIRVHMFQLKNGDKEPSKKSYIKLFNKLNDAKIPIEDYVMLTYCDNQGNLAKPRLKFQEFIRESKVLKKYYEMKYSEEPMTVKDLKVSGKDVIKYLEIKQGPRIGEILKGLFDAVMDGELKNKRAELLLQLKAGG